MFAINRILFNHESTRRGKTFVTRKITRAVAWIEAALQDDLYRGNLHAVLDRRCAPEFVEAMWLMLQDDEPNGYVVATGSAYSVRNFVQLDWEKHDRCGNRYLRTEEVDALIGDASLTRRTIGWVSQVQTPELARIIVDAGISTLDSEGAAPWVHRAWAHG